MPNYPAPDKIASLTQSDLLYLYLHFLGAQSPEEEAIYDAICRLVVSIFGNNHRRAVIIAELEQQLAAAQERERWIPVTERLPEAEGEYLVWAHNNYFVYYFRNGFKVDEVTHWRELPAPPREAANE